MPTVRGLGLSREPRAPGYVFAGDVGGGLGVALKDFLAILSHGFCRWTVPLPGMPA